MKRESRKALSGFLFVFPSLLFVIAFLILPLLYTFVLSLTKYNFSYDFYPKFRGILNYIDVFKDPWFVNAMKNTFIFGLAAIPLGVLLPLIAALMVDSIEGFTMPYEISIFIPIVVPISLGALMFLLILDSSYGYITYFAEKILHLRPFNWTDNGTVTLAIVVLVSNWTLGYQIILFIGGLKMVDQELLEAAEIDGATRIQRIVYVTLPQIRETTAVVTVFALMRALKVFVQPMVMTDGGPMHATETLYYYMYRTAFNLYQMGLASTMAYILSFIILIASLINLKVFRFE